MSYTVQCGEVLEVKADHPVHQPVYFELGDSFHSLFRHDYRHFTQQDI